MLPFYVLYLNIYFLVFFNYSTLTTLIRSKEEYKNYQPQNQTIQTIANPNPKPHNQLKTNKNPTHKQTTQIIQKPTIQPLENK
ncbi:hypothetical protein [Candidatus Phytoplasma asteris]|uniref:hypothetical protein n=1 Tax=Candidatus Phytoplasma asteris TaxID=85620 RepID=UPI0002E40D78